MKTKVFKVLLFSILSIIGLFFTLFLLLRFVFRDQAVGFLREEQYKERLEVLRSSGGYIETSEVELHFEYSRDSVQAKEICDYFRLDTLLSSESSTWENTLALARFVAGHIPHANQAVQPKSRNAIALWKYHFEVEPAFNCRLHAIMLHELLLASGITNRFMTCMPADSTDQDCHVVNIVWLPERKKWAMIDSDGCAYVTNAEGIPLSLEEMRQYTIDGKTMKVSPLGVGRTYDDYLSYWTKNLYWFSCWEETGFNKESGNLGDQESKGRYVYLLPEGYEDCFMGFGANTVCTSDASAFWAAPDIYKSATYQ